MAPGFLCPNSKSKWGQMEMAGTKGGGSGTKGDGSGPRARLERKKPDTVSSAGLVVFWIYFSTTFSV